MVYRNTINQPNTHTAPSSLDKPIALLLKGCTEEVVYLHNLLFVTCSKAHAATSTQAREYVYTTLLETPNFQVEEAPIGEEAVCDWFVIGGRFSGLLAKFRKPATLSQIERDFHRDLGYADDAMLLDQVLYLRLLGQYEGRAIGRRMEQLAFLDLDGERVSPQFIKNKWLVVVDYHS